MNIGDKIVIKEGPYKNRQGVIVSLDPLKVKVMGIILCLFTQDVLELV